VEGSEALVQRSRQNAQRNGLTDKTSFEARNLFEITPDDLVAFGPADKWLVDPPREGAFALAKALADLQSAPRPDWTPPRASSTSAATRPRWRATPACWCMWRATAAWRRVR
jgi:23S rRNA (uracil1939-C5)-methyltransferase